MASKGHENRVGTWTSTTKGVLPSSMQPVQHRKKRVSEPQLLLQRQNTIKCLKFSTFTGILSFSCFRQPAKHRENALSQLYILFCAIESLAMHIDRRHTEGILQKCERQITFLFFGRFSGLFLQGENYLCKIYRHYVTDSPLAEARHRHAPFYRNRSMHACRRAAFIPLAL